MKKDNDKSSDNIWFDMTDMMSWRGHFTGIQRVSYEHAKRFVSSGAHIFIYDYVDERFIEIPFSVIEDRIQSHHDEEAEPKSILRKIRSVVGAPYYVLPKGVKNVLRPLVQVANKTVRSIVDKTVKGRIPISGYRDYPEVTFSKGDKVILMGAGWNESAVLHSLAEIKASLGIEIIHHLNDILPIYQPQLFADELPKIFRPYIDEVIRVADKISVISEATKRDVLIYCKENSLPAPVIEFIQLGEDVKTIQPKRPKELNAEERFIFALGTVEVRKNYILLYQAVKLAQLEDKELPKIVIAGRKGWLSSDLLHLISHDPYTKDHIVWLSDVNDETLAWLYKNCLFTVFPSLCEGWGLPVVESLQYGKFALVSGISSMLETGKGFVDYFLPYDARECLAKIEYYLAEDRFTMENKKIRNGYKVFTWDDSFIRMKSFVDQ